MPGIYDCIYQLCGRIASIHDKQRIFDLRQVESGNHVLRRIPLTGLTTGKTGVHNDAVEQVIHAGNKCLNLRRSLTCLHSIELRQLLSAGKIQTSSINSKQLITFPAGYFCFFIEIQNNFLVKLLKCLGLNSLPPLGKSLFGIRNFPIFLSVNENIQTYLQAGFQILNG